MASLANKGLAFINKLMVRAKPQLDVFLKYAKVEMVPPMPADIPVLKDDISKIIRGVRNGAYKKVTVREAWLNTLIAVEVCFWFYMGECIGKRHLVGYKV